MYSNVDDRKQLCSSCFLLQNVIGHHILVLVLFMKNKNYDHYYKNRQLIEKVQTYYITVYYTVYSIGIQFW